jgi:hypothetical protein
MSKSTIRCLSRTLTLAVAVLVVGAGAALAQHTTGVNITKTCPVFVNQGDTYNCTYSLQNQDPDHGVINLVVFDSHPPVACPATQLTACAGEVQVACAGGLTATTLAAKNLAGDTCGGNLPDFTAPITCVTTDSETDVDNVRAGGNDAGITALIITGSTQNGPVIAGLTCPPDTNECTNDICTPGVGCEHPPAADSTPCTDNDANACTTAGCEAGACVQAHQSTTCAPDNNECTDDPACDPATGLCTHPNKSDSTPCTDADANACTTAGCEAGACVQTHQTTVCTPDNNECTSDPACDPATGLCTHPNVADSTPCTDTDNLSCTTAGCESGSCVQTHIEACGVPGRMTGGGSIFTKAGGRVTHGFELHCDPEIGPNNLEINWGNGNHFHLETLLTAVCTDDPTIVPRPPSADFDTYNGTGTGSCNGVEGASITFELTDAGEPGKVDFASFEITGCPDGLTLSVSGNLNKGNQQAHKQ